MPEQSSQSDRGGPLGGRLLARKWPIAVGVAAAVAVIVGAGTVYFNRSGTFTVMPLPSGNTQQNPGTVTITSEPQGAHVRLSSGQEGYTPFVAGDIQPGTYQLELELETYQPIREELQVKAGEGLVRSFTMQLLPASLEVADPELDGASLFVDGDQRGALPQKVTGLTPGKHLVRIERDGQAIWDGEIELGIAEERRLDLRPGLSSWIDTLSPGEKAFPVAIMVENSPDARPQSGLHAAAVVYEALAEGGISRFMAVYMKGTSAVIGPVRSARDYYVKLAKEFNAPLVHIGASPQGYEALRELGVPSLDETYGMQGFWRSRARVAPHNAYVSTTSVREALSAYGVSDPGTYAGFTFNDNIPPGAGSPATDVVVDYGWGYRVGYEFEPSTNLYKRSMAGGPHIDAETGEQLRAANVVTMTVGTDLIAGDDKGRLELDQVGEGKARVFRDGRVIEGTWRKTSFWTPTQFLDASGTQIALKRGQTWVQIVPQNATITY